MQKHKLTKIIFLIILLVEIVWGQSIEADSMDTSKKLIGFDKIQHTAVSCLLTLSGQYIFESKSDLKNKEALLFSASAAAGIGLAKELNDMNVREEQFDWGDMIANILGIGLGVLIINL